MPDLYTNNEPVEDKIRNFMDRKMQQHPDIKTMRMQDITDYLDY